MPERDAIPALTTLICLIQNIMIAINPYKLLDENVHLYSVIAIFVLLFNTIGKLLIVSRAQLNFKLVSSEYKKYGVLVMEDDTEASGYTRGLINDMPCLAYNKRTDFLTDFMYYSYGEDASDKISKFLVPISLGAALILFIAMQFVMRDIYVAATAFTATICICSPLSHLFVVNAPLKRAAKKLYKYGCAILGYKSAEDFSETNATIIHAKDLFPHGAVTLFGIKTFSGMRIDEAILDAASVACSARSILSDIFMQVIAHKTELLKKVDNILYEDTMGLSAWVENKRVLIGTRELMLNHGVDVPSKDYEERYISEGNELIYLSTAGELTAVFVIGFKAMPEVKDALKKLEQNDVFLVVNSVDAVLTRDKLAIVFDVPKEMFKIMPARLHSHYSEITQKTPQLSSSVVNNGAFFSYITGLVVAKRMKSMMMIGNVVQAASMVVGYGLLAVFSFLRDFSQLTTLLLFVFQLSWFVVTMITMKIKQL
ncbi:MAG: hypothetical protein K0R90_1343 [Oscillospiraceae bacterium]|nr:hypothetical protein [Oscillospiraceae bacterium]